MIEFPAMADMHVHLREGNLLKEVINETANVCQYALAMPNLREPITTAERVNLYRLETIEHGKNCHFLMTAKLLPWMKPSDIYSLKEAGITALKIYPEGVTTNSEDGFSREYFIGENNLFKNNLFELLNVATELGIVICMHGELPGAEVLNRETEFLPFLNQIKKIPNIRFVLEHITTDSAIDAIVSLRESGVNCAATITLHHLVMTLDDVIGSKLKPHNFCMPVAKWRKDREKLLTIALSGREGFFLGSDSAPHVVSNKECADCCAGCYTAPVLCQQLLEIFLDTVPLQNFIKFTSGNAKEFYRLGGHWKNLWAEPREWVYNGEQDETVRPWAYGRKLKYMVISQ